MKIKALLLTLSASAMAFAQEAAPAAEQAPSGIMQFLPFILIFAVMWLFFIRPQQKERKQMEAMRSALKKGDKILTAAGIVGTVVAMEEGSSTITIKSADSKLEIEKAAILRVTNTEAAPAESK